LVEERAAFRGEVTHLLARAGLDAEFAGVHPKTVTADRGPLVRGAVTSPS
jgi:hypothetical protein